MHNLRPQPDSASPAAALSLPNPAICRPELDDFAAACRCEWLVTNGIGGYASSSVLGANMRRYHGLLVAALHPPLGRSVLLSKLEETLHIVTRNKEGEQAFALSTNQYPGVIHPEGYHSLTAWTAYPMPTWTWSPLPELHFEKRIWMAHGQNTTCIAYRLLDAPEGSVARLDLVPLLAWKDYHSEMRAYPGVLDAAWSTPEPGALHVTLPGVWNVMARPVTLRLHVAQDDGAPFPNAWFTAQPDWYRNLQHPREQERGLDFEEDLYTPGSLSALLQVGETIVIIATVEEGSVPAPQAARAEMIERQNRMLRLAGSADPFGSQLLLAADQFIVKAPGGRATIIAGYHWFSDWGRDTMISLPGLCLTTGQADAAHDILRAYAGYVSEGMLPNRFPDQGETPEYNTVDATLWYFQAVRAYLEAVPEDHELARDLWETLQEIVAWHIRGTRYGIGVDPEDGLLRAGEPGVQLTWMDAKVGDWVVTPRTGKPVEINALWYSALCIMEKLAATVGGDPQEYRKRARQAANSFRTAFVRPDGRGLYDVITPTGPDGSIRPNQIFAVSLPYSPLIAAEQRAVVDCVMKELLTPMGLRTLAPEDPAYRPRYEGNPAERDGAYHQGTVWAWLLGPFAQAHSKVYGDPARARAFLLPLQKHLMEAGIGTISEVFDAEPPHKPGGCIAQAWSVAETLRVWRALSEHEQT